MLHPAQQRRRRVASWVMGAAFVLAAADAFVAIAVDKNSTTITNAAAHNGSSCDVTSVAEVVRSPESLGGKGLSFILRLTGTRVEADRFASRAPELLAPRHGVRHCAPAPSRHRAGEWGSPQREVMSPHVHQPEPHPFA